jgi:hypothetical protein
MVPLKCETTAPDGSHGGTINDFSENGLGLLCNRPAGVGEEFDIRWRLQPTEQPVELHCVVRDANPSRVGVEFVKLGRANRLRLLHFICDKQLERADVGAVSQPPKDPKSFS